MSWNDFYQLQTLSISTADVNYSSVSIYGNKKNQVKLLIKLMMVDSDRKELVLSNDDRIEEKLYLCDYQTGVELNKNDWTITYTPGDFVGVLNGQTFANAENPEPRIRNLYLYLSTSKVNFAQDIAVGIRIPAENGGVLDYNTSMDGTSTLNGPGGNSGSTFRSPSRINVRALIPVDYSLPDKVKVTARVTSEDSYTLDVGNIKQERNQALYDKHDGTISYNNKMYIESSLDNHYFFKKEFDDTITGIATLSGMSRNAARKIPQTFKIPAGRDAKGGEWTSLYALFIDTAEFGLRGGTGRITMMQDYSAHIDPHVVFQAENSLRGYQTTLNSRHINVSSIRFGFTFDNLRIPRASDSEAEWKLSTNSIHVTVTDNFGNSGVVTIEMISKNESPYIEVNRV
ncbi:hypothetical protein [Enterobacter ludwigii]